MKTITKTFNLNDIHNNDSNTNNTADNCKIVVEGD